MIGPDEPTFCRADGPLDDRGIEQMDEYIQTLANLLAPHGTVPIGDRDLEASELRQLALIKLWHTQQRQRIYHPRAYMKRLVHNASVDMLRKHRAQHIVSLDDEDVREIYEGGRTVDASLLDDPLYASEFDEIPADRLRAIADVVCRLTRAERRAMICALKGYEEAAYQLLDELRQRGLPVDTTVWPDKLAARRSLRVSLSNARKKLRCSLRDVD